MTSHDKDQHETKGGTEPRAQGATESHPPLAPSAGQPQPMGVPRGGPVPPSNVRMKAPEAPGAVPVNPYGPLEEPRPIPGTLPFYFAKIYPNDMAEPATPEGVAHTEGFGPANVDNPETKAGPLSQRQARDEHAKGAPPPSPPARSSQPASSR